MQTDRFLRIWQVENLIGLDRSTIYKYIRDGKFPEPMRIGLRASGWREREIREWIEHREAKPYGRRIRGDTPPRKEQQ